MTSLAEQNMPLLPAETWFEILHHATAVPDPMFRPQRVFFRDGYDLAEGPISRFKESMAVKRSLVLVCRQWNALATSLLYEHIHLETVEQLDTLLKAVQRSPPFQDEGDRRTFGSFVKRLNFDVPGMTWAPSHSPSQLDLDGAIHGIQTDPDNDSRIVRMCKALPNLVTLIYTSDDVYGALETLPFSKVISASLKYLYSKNAFDMPIKEFFAFLDSHPRLVYLDPPLVHLPFTSTVEIPIEVAESQKRALTELQELVVYSVLQSDTWLSRIPFRLPNLARLTFAHDILVDDVALGEMLARHCANVTSIQIKVDDHSLTEALDMWCILIKKHCPRLNELSIATGPGGMLGHGAAPLSFRIRGIKTLGLQDYSWHTEDSSVMGEPAIRKRLLLTALCMADCFPDLSTISIPDERNVRALQMEDMGDLFVDFLKDCRARRLNVVDNFGSCLN